MRFRRAMSLDPMRGVAEGESESTLGVDPHRGSYLPCSGASCQKKEPLWSVLDPRKNKQETWKSGVWLTGDRVQGPKKGRGVGACLKTWGQL